MLTALALALGWEVNTVGDMGQLPDAFPHFFIPNVPFTWETLQIIFPFSLTMAAVGLLESMMTAQIVDDLTDTPSDKAQESKAQGLANFVTGFFGGMGGCAMIGQSVINVKSGGSTRLSTFVAGTFLLFLIVVLGPFVSQIPMPSLVAVMIMVSIGTFSWKSIRDLRTHPWQSSVVMVVTVVVVVWTHDLAQGVAAGVILSGLFFASKVRGLFNVTSTLRAMSARAPTTFPARCSSRPPNVSPTPSTSRKFLIVWSSMSRKPIFGTFQPLAFSTKRYSNSAARARALT